MFSRENLAILTIVRRPDQTGTIPGELVEAGLGIDINGDIDFTQGRFLNSPASTEPTEPTITESLAAVFVSSTLFQALQSTSMQSSNLTRLIFVVYNGNNSLFRDPTIESTGSIILSFLRSPLQEPTPTDLEEPVTIQFQANQVNLSSLSCMNLFINRRGL